MDYILGILGDNTWIFWEGYRLKYGSYADTYYGYNNFEAIRTFSESLTWNIFFGLSRYIDVVLLWNLFILIILSINFLLLYILYRKFFPKFISGILGLICIFSPYFFYRYTEHLSLLSVYFYALVIIILLRLHLSYKSVFLLSIITGLAFSFSNYIGFFTTILVSLYLILLALLKVDLFFNKIMQMCVYAFLSLVFVFIFNYKYIYYNFIYPVSNTGIDSVSRNLEDFFYFTSRPWYYLLPSPENPWFGNYTKSTINWLQNDWGYWLTTNYFPSEHSTSYLGYVNIFFAILGVVYVYKKLTLVGVIKFKKVNLFKHRYINLVYLNNNIHEVLKNNADSFKYINVLLLGIIAIIFFILTLPPYFTISLHKIYMPSYILWEIFPMFRVLSRLGILILIVTLIYTGFGYLYFISYINKLLSKLFIYRSSLVGLSKNGLVKKYSLTYLFLIPFITLSLIEFYVPIKITNVSRSPEIYTYIKNNTTFDSVLAVYPYNKTNASVFWMREHNRVLVNPRGYVNSDIEFESGLFTSNLNNCGGISKARELGVDYLIYFYNEDEKGTSDFFDTTPILSRVVDFKEVGEDLIDRKYYKVINLSNAKSFSSVLYKINYDVDCR